MHFAVVACPAIVGSANGGVELPQLCGVHALPPPINPPRTLARATIGAANTMKTIRASAGKERPNECDAGMLTSLPPRDRGRALTSRGVGAVQHGKLRTCRADV